MRSRLAGTTMIMYKAETYLVLASLIICAHGAFKCEVKTQQSISDYRLSSRAVQGILFKNGQGGGGFQAIDCVCEGTSRHVFDDDLIEKFPTSDPKWEDSAVLRVRDCKNLELDLSEYDGDLPQTLDRGALIIENVDEMRVLSFKYGFRSNEPKRNEKAFSSIYFRNINMTAGTQLDFEEKVEVLLHQVRMTDENSDPLIVKSTNSIKGINPIIRIEECQFNLGDNLQSKREYFEIEVINEHQVEDSTSECSKYYDYEGEVYFKRNTLSKLGTGRFYVNGASKVIVEDNLIEVLELEAFEMKQVEELDIVRNIIRNDRARPSFKVEYEKDISKCTNQPDLPEDRIKGKITMNRVWRVRKSMAEVAFSGYSDEEKLKIAKKIKLEENAGWGFCQCAELNAKEDQANLLIENKILRDSICASSVTGGIGKRKSICAGSHPRPFLGSLLNAFGLDSGTPRNEVGFLFPLSIAWTTFAIGIGRL
ncbi:hypothetical protein TCAL_06983 [Tigriopus californicus]|uniref:Uncharacterized protein n=1 Tax=Tigriopus californicus TaxID=6832 RepID=A0A553P8K6_TIGCA|nr:uncharacterized protein LOC131878021 [Tigriopus californicus]TRY74000.1 hypothetical protein TCAL_06983 [Tigriopus californicus]|eukprot:TCALIF_06983-PA protein Name:"Protein of unknown function" AED:0.22 eAED:0.22 QI:183/1/0.66/1/1/1/3/0/479